MAEVKVLVEGIHKMLDDGKMRIGSTVTLIKSNKNIIVDTGSFLDKDQLIEGLNKEGFSVEDIDAVILTHLHLDHTVNTYLFKNAKIYYRLRGGNFIGLVGFPQEGKIQRNDLENDTEIAENVSILLTPGHTEDLISVVVKTSVGNVIITGDAIDSEKMADLNNPPGFYWDLDEFNKSRRKILEIADYIIPGHGGMFKVK
ncbi:MAG: MBL fold metallo-hydrolase [Nanoarchaeota archaeon]|nr:MBL fold metallo-hydrolase [Nanoarchaeota archaeon]